jgi:hypothetical protein
MRGDHGQNVRVVVRVPIDVVVAVAVYGAGAAERLNYPNTSPRDHRMRDPKDVGNDVIFVMECPPSNARALLGAAYTAGPLHRGRTVDPIKNKSTACAAWRPSRIAQTIRDWPRRMSPQAKTFGIEVL